MSRLYVESATDMVKTKKTARANKWMETNLYFNPNDYNDKINIQCKPDKEEGMICIIYFKDKEIGRIKAKSDLAMVLQTAEFL